MKSLESLSQVFAANVSGTVQPSVAPAPSNAPAP